MTLHLRPATLEDARFLFELRNDPLTRESSRNTEEVPWENHIAWLQKSLSGAVPTRKLYVAEDNGTRVGTLRSDTHEDGSEELSWTVGPEARGKGYGKAMVLQFVSEVLSGKKVIASIKKGHTGSEKIAAALGLTSRQKENPDEQGDSPLMIWE